MVVQKEKEAVTNFLDPELALKSQVRVREQWVTLKENINLWTLLDTKSQIEPMANKQKE